MKKISRRAFLSVMAAAGAAAALTACGGGSGSSTAASGGASVGGSQPGGHKLTAYAWDKNFNIPALNAAAADYKENVDPEFELEVIEQSGGGDIENAITLAGSAHDYSNLPDIVQFQDHYIQRYVADYPDAFVPVEGADIDWDGFSKEKLSYSIVDGVHYGVPVDNSTVIFAYRTDLLAEVGKTVDDMTGIKWSDLTDIGEQVYPNVQGRTVLALDGKHLPVSGRGSSDHADPGNPAGTAAEQSRFEVQGILPHLRVSALCNFSGFVLPDLQIPVCNGRSGKHGFVQAGHPANALQLPRQSHQRKDHHYSGSDLALDGLQHGVLLGRFAEHRLLGVRGSQN